MFNYVRTIPSQYATSPTLVQLIENYNTCIEPGRNLEAFYDQVWNVETAVGYGLDVWGRIVGVGRVLEVAAGTWFGFAEAAGSVGFGQAAFYSGETLTENYSLTDQAYRQLIFAKAATNITDCSIPAINATLMTLFSNRGNAYVTDGRNGPWPAGWFGLAEAGDAAGFDQEPFGDALPFPTAENMTMTYTFDFPLYPYEVSIVVNSGVLPKPVGVLATASYPGTVV